MGEVMEYMLMRHLNISYAELAKLPEKKVWRLYAMLMYELEQRKEVEERAAGVQRLRPPH